MEASLRPVHRDDIVTLTIDHVAFEGRAVARLDGFVVFVDGAVPGDTVEAKIFRTKKQFAEARVVEVLVPSPHRVTPACTHFGTCGGCRWQHLSYEQQLVWKEQNVRESYERLGGFTGVRVHATVASEHVFFYRNKMEFSFAAKRWLLPHEIGTVSPGDEPFALGLHAPGRYDKVLRIEACHLQSEESNAILNATRTFFEARGLNAWDSDKMEGTLRNLVIREGGHTGDRMVYLLTSGLDEAVLTDYATLLREPRLGVTTFVHGLSRRKAQVSTAETMQVMFGEGLIRDSIGGAVFEVSPLSFFQTNTLQAERLYAVAADYAQLSADDDVWDLYCGTGTIALFLAPRVRSVLGIELNAAAVADAQENARRNGIANARFECADILHFARAAASGSEPAPSRIILDPPRAGLHPSIIPAIAPLGVPRIVYVSCNPATSARDCALFAEHGYEIEEITPVDMFPHTYHIECVVSLRLRTD